MAIFFENLLINHQNGSIINKTTEMVVKREKAVNHMKRNKRKTVWAYLDGKKLVDVVQAALDNNIMVEDVKALLIKENPGHEVTFKVQ